MTEWQRFGCLDTWPCSRKQTTSLRFPIEICLFITAGVDASIYSCALSTIKDAGCDGDGESTLKTCHCKGNLCNDPNSAVSLAGSAVFALALAAVANQMF